MIRYKNLVVAIIKEMKEKISNQKAIIKWQKPFILLCLSPKSIDMKFFWMEASLLAFILWMKFLKI